MDKKAGFFTLTLYDVVAHLIPGLLFLFSIFYIEKEPFQLRGDFTWVFLLTAGYITGHFLSAFGIFLYTTHYHPRDFKEKTKKRLLVSLLHTTVKTLVRQNYDYDGLNIKSDLSKLIKTKLKISELNNLALYQFADSLVAQTNYTEREIMLVKQALYRSLTAIIVILIPYIVYRGGMGLPMLFWAVMYFLLLRLLLYIHTYYRHIRKSQVYALAFVLLKQM